MKLEPETYELPMVSDRNDCVQMLEDENLNEQTKDSHSSEISHRNDARNSSTGSKNISKSNSTKIRSFPKNSPKLNNLPNVLIKSVTCTICEKVENSVAYIKEHIKTHHALDSESKKQQFTIQYKVVILARHSNPYIQCFNL